ncbi:MAG: hypothetical protein JWM95_1718 [Gemmatimonadetes bacterium]|nr:hypothetical protein [Gemmatimonadota bacterium]
MSGATEGSALAVAEMCANCGFGEAAHGEGKCKRVRQTDWFPAATLTHLIRNDPRFAAAYMHGHREGVERERVSHDEEEGRLLRQLNAARVEMRRLNAELDRLYTGIQALRVRE